MMGSLLLWCYCDKCGRKIMVGETCYDVGADTFCEDCCKAVNTLHEWERQADGGDEDA